MKQGFANGYIPHILSATISWQPTMLACPDMQYIVLYPLPRPISFFFPIATVDSCHVLFARSSSNSWIGYA